MPEYWIIGKSLRTGKTLQPKRYIASSEADAIASAKDDGRTADSIRVRSVVSFNDEVAGVSHKNSDNSSRQKLIRETKRHEPVLLIRETANKHDANAIAVCRRSDGRQLGYLPAQRAKQIVNVLLCDQGARYAAICSSVGQMERSELLGLELLVVVAIPGTTDDEIQKHLGSKEFMESNGSKAIRLANFQRLDATDKVTQSLKRQGNKSEPKKKEASGCLIAVVAILASATAIFAAIQ